jgi:hypothetical protein
MNLWGDQNQGKWGSRLFVFAYNFDVYFLLLDGSDFSKEYSHQLITNVVLPDRSEELSNATYFVTYRVDGYQDSPHSGESSVFFSSS